MIYLLRSYGKDGKSLLKIGYTKDGKEGDRFRQYKVHNPGVEFLYTIEGGTRDHEARLHHHFHRFLSIGNEWFSESEEILSYFKKCTLKTFDSLPLLPGIIEAETDDGIKKLLKENINPAVDIFFNEYFKIDSKIGRARYYRNYYNKHTKWTKVLEKVTSLLPKSIYDLSFQWWKL